MPTDEGPATEAPEDPGVMAQKVVSAVDRITDRPEKIVALVDELKARYPREDKLAKEIISHYSTRSAISGGASALPTLLPGIGTVAYLVTGPLADMLLLLKFEVEMCCALAHAHGFDIARPGERQLALLLAAVKTEEASGGRNVLADLGEASWTAIWNYAPRRVSKAVLRSVGILVVRTLAKRLVLKAIPVIGVAVGAGMNKLLTKQVGKQASAELVLRKRLVAEAARAETARPAPAEPAADAPRGGVRVAASPLRCPYCHDDVAPEGKDWVACKACLARHHRDCWDEAKACSTCGKLEFLGT